jgi:hypothetical protein
MKKRAAGGQRVLDESIIRASFVGCPSQFRMCTNDGSAQARFDISDDERARPVQSYRRDVGFDRAT